MNDMRKLMEAIDHAVRGPQSSRHVREIATDHLSLVERARGILEDIESVIENLLAREDDPSTYEQIQEVHEQMRRDFYVITEALEYFGLHDGPSDSLLDVE